MIRLMRNPKTGDYYTEDKKFMIEKGYIDWNINILDPRGWYKNWGYADTLKEARESLEVEYNG